MGFTFNPMFQVPVFHEKTLYDPVLHVYFSCIVQAVLQRLCQPCSLKSSRRDVHCSRRSTTPTTSYVQLKERFPRDGTRDPRPGQFTQDVTRKGFSPAIFEVPLPESSTWNAVSSGRGKSVRYQYAVFLFPNT